MTDKIRLKVSPYETQLLIQSLTLFRVQTNSNEIEGRLEELEGELTDELVGQSDDSLSSRGVTKELRETILAQFDDDGELNPSERYIQ